jgi:hypothetical protein
MDALDQLIKYGRKRGRELFPEGVPGLFPLSKSDVNQDLDAMLIPAESTFMASNTATSPTHKSGRKKTETDALTTIRPSKRARLLEKVNREIKALEAVETKEKDLRNLLDVVRDETKKYEVGIDQKTKEIAVMEAEREEKKLQYLEVQNQHETRVAILNEDAQKNQTILSNLKNSIIQITQKVRVYHILLKTKNILVN